MDEGGGHIAEYQRPIVLPRLVGGQDIIAAAGRSKLVLTYIRDSGCEAEIESLNSYGIDGVNAAVCIYVPGS